MIPSDWQVVRELLIDKTGDRIGALQAQSVGGGDINLAYRLSDGRHRYFAKTNIRDRLPMFEAELQGLDEILHSDSIRVPRPIGCGIAGEQAFIVMEYIELTGRANEVELARRLAAMHRYTGEQFGFAIDNTIGSSPQPNRYDSNWVEFWQQQRLGFQLSLAETNGYGGELFDTGMRLNQRVGEFFSSYNPVPSLLHGDLWGGNQGADASGEPVIYDPACYYGDHEADLAMMELFGRPGENFFRAYREVFPVDPGYGQRRDLYNLYHLLNHANLFDGSYAGQAQAMINNLLKKL
ncbi:MAG: fructosamine kinase family protein [Gammaproteobacteria bacterium]